MSEYISFQELEVLFKITRPTLKKRLKLQNVIIHSFDSGREKYIKKNDVEKLNPKGVV